MLTLYRSDYVNSRGMSISIAGVPAEIRKQKHQITVHEFNGLSKVL